MPQGSGIGSKADYGKRGDDRAVEKRKSDGMGAEGEWDKGKGGGTNCESFITELSFSL